MAGNDSDSSVLLQTNDTHRVGYRYGSVEEQSADASENGRG